VVGSAVVTSVVDTADEMLAETVVDTPLAEAVPSVSSVSVGSGSGACVVVVGSGACVVVVEGLLLVVVVDVLVVVVGAVFVVVVFVVLDFVVVVVFVVVVDDFGVVVVVVVVTTTLPSSSVVVVVITVVVASAVPAEDVDARPGDVVGSVVLPTTEASESVEAGSSVPSTIVLAVLLAASAEELARGLVTARAGTATTTAAATPPTMGRRSNRGRGARCLPTYLMTRSRPPDRGPAAVRPVRAVGETAARLSVSPDSPPDVDYAVHRAVTFLRY